MFGTSKKELWCCKGHARARQVARRRVHSLRGRQGGREDVIGAFAGVLTESRFQLLIKDLASENYAGGARRRGGHREEEEDQGLHASGECPRLQEGHGEGVRGGGQAIFAYRPGSYGAEPRGQAGHPRRGAAAPGHVRGRGHHHPEGPRASSSRRRRSRRAAAATKEAKDHNEFVTVKQTEVLADEVKKNNEQNMAHQDWNTEELKAQNARLEEKVGFLTDVVEGLAYRLEDGGFLCPGRAAAAAQPPALEGVQNDNLPEADFTEGPGSSVERAAGVDAGPRCACRGTPSSRMINCRRSRGRKKMVYRRRRRSRRPRARRRRRRDRQTI